MKILYTAFKGIHNTSFQLVSGVEKEALYLTNSFSGLYKDISSVNGDYDAVIMFVDKNLSNQIRLEACAEYHGDLLCTDFNIAEFGRKCTEKLIPYSLSHHPTAYLCNAAY